jgi:NAD+ synthetase
MAGTSRNADAATDRSRFEQHASFPRTVRDGVVEARARASAKGHQADIKRTSSGHQARQWMTAQYATAGARSGVVIGTDHAAESLMGFFTRFGKGGADILALAGLTRRRVRVLARALGAPGHPVMKVVTADLETLAPQKADERQRCNRLRGYRRFPRRQARRRRGPDDDPAFLNGDAPQARTAVTPD